MVGALEDGRGEAEAAGIPNLNSGVEMTRTALFLTGSITKVWVTTLRPRIPRIRDSCDDAAAQQLWMDYGEIGKLTLLQ